jgi:hypothetical protein
MLAGVTLHNFFLIGLLSVVFTIAFKWVAARPGMPAGIRDLAKNV